jgi:hypothetical protein
MFGQTYQGKASYDKALLRARHVLLTYLREMHDITVRHVRSRRVRLSHVRIMHIRIMRVRVMHVMVCNVRVIHIMV